MSRTFLLLLPLWLAFTNPAFTVGDPVVVRPVAPELETAVRALFAPLPPQYLGVAQAFRDNVALRWAPDEVEVQQHLAQWIARARFVGNEDPASWEREARGRLFWFTKDGDLRLAKILATHPYGRVIFARALLAYRERLFPRTGGPLPLRSMVGWDAQSLSLREEQSLAKQSFHRNTLAALQSDTASTIADDDLQLLEKERFVRRGRSELSALDTRQVARLLENEALRLAYGRVLTQVQIQRVNDRLSAALHLPQRSFVAAMLSLEGSRLASAAFLFRVRTAIQHIMPWLSCGVMLEAARVAGT